MINPHKSKSNNILTSNFVKSFYQFGHSASTGEHISGPLQPPDESLPGQTFMPSLQQVGQWFQHPLQSFLGIQVSGVICPKFPSWTPQHPGQWMVDQSHSTGQNPIQICENNYRNVILK